MVGRSWHPGYCEKVRQAGVIGLCSGDETAQQVADRLGVSRPTLYSWKEQLLGREAPSSMKRRKANLRCLNVKSSSDSLKPSSVMSASYNSSMIS